MVDIGKGEKRTLGGNGNDVWEWWKGGLADPFGFWILIINKEGQWVVTSLDRTVFYGNPHFLMLSCSHNFSFPPVPHHMENTHTSFLFCFF